MRFLLLLRFRTFHAFYHQPFSLSLAKPRTLTRREPLVLPEMQFDYRPMIAFFGDATGEQVGSPAFTITKN